MEKFNLDIYRQNRSYKFLYILENLFSFQEDGQSKIIRIGNVIIETITIPGGIGGRTATIKSNFKIITSVNISGFVNKGQTQEILMRQVIHSNTIEIASTKKVEVYSAGTQTILLTIIGTV